MPQSICLAARREARARGPLPVDSPRAAFAAEEPADALDRLAETVDRGVHASLARLTLGLSPAALAEAYLDWAAHLAFSPGKQGQLLGKATRKWTRLARFAIDCAISGRDAEPCIEPLPQDRRFS